MDHLKRVDVKMRHLICSNYFIFAALFFFCASCSNKQYQVLFEQKKNISDHSTQKDTAVINYYRIQPQDILQIRNLQDIKYIVNETPVSNSTLGTGSSQGQSFQVDEDGTVALPVLGRVKVAGLTRAEANKLIEDMYRKDLLKDPIIEVKITNLKVTLLGEVKATGNYPLTKDKTTLVEMLGNAGGLTDKANGANIEIIRGTEKNPEVTVIDLTNIQSVNDPRAVLQSGDIVYVAQNKRAARNDNLQNFSTVFQPLLLLFNTALIVLTLIRR